jgi:hypothetical protein
MGDTNKYKNIITEELLRKYYVNEQLGAYKIAKIFNCSQHVIYRLLKKFNLQEDRSGKININQKLGNFTTVERLGKIYNGTYKWKCKCICGNYKELNTAELKANKVKSCGCLRKRGEDHHLWTGYKDISGNRWKNIEANAKKRGFKFEITKEEVWSILEEQEFKCSLSDLSISFNNKTASIDRINPELHYDKSNIWLVHKDVNRIRWTSTIKEFLNWCSLVTNPNKRTSIFSKNINIYCSLWKNIIYNANKRKINFNITKKDIIELYINQKGQCSITGIEITLPKNKEEFRNKKFTASLDRIDSNNDYNINNIQWVHKFINQSRSNFSLSYYKGLCKRVHENSIC